MIDQRVGRNLGIVYRCVYRCVVSVDLSPKSPQHVRTIWTGSTLNGTEAPTANIYDHLLAFDLAATVELAGRGSRHADSSCRNKAFFDTYSLQLPSVARFQIDADDN